MREKSGAGMMDCKNALLENNGDLEKSINWLEKKNSNAEKKVYQNCLGRLNRYYLQKQYLINKNKEGQIMIFRLFKTVLDIGIQKYDLPAY